MDLSSLFKTGTTPGRAEVGALAFVNYIDRAHEIHTDRLHVGITGALLQKRVYLYDNSYGKVKGVYQHSLHANFPLVQFIP
jgi:exopolysaccharide biosynthesis predicted pyruvyltransferase EpsI